MPEVWGSGRQPAGRAALLSTRLGLSPRSTTAETARLAAACRGASLVERAAATPTAHVSYQTVPRGVHPVAREREWRTVVVRLIYGYIRRLGTNALIHLGHRAPIAGHAHHYTRHMRPTRGAPRRWLSHAHTPDTPTTAGTASPAGTRVAEPNRVAYSTQCVSRPTPRAASGARDSIGIGSWFGRRTLRGYGRGRGWHSGG
jgi:hypothetical protein